MAEKIEDETAPVREALRATFDAEPITRGLRHIGEDAELPALTPRETGRRKRSARPALPA